MRYSLKRTFRVRMMQVLGTLDAGCGWTSKATILRRTDLPETVVRRALDKLAENGRVQVNDQHHAHLYRRSTPCRRRARLPARRRPNEGGQNRYRQTDHGDHQPEHA